MVVRVLLRIRLPLKDEQFEKAKLPIVLTESGIVNEPVNLEHS